MARGRLVAIVVAAGVLSIASVTQVARGVAASELWVDGSTPACSDARSREEAASSATPWCSLARGAAGATPPRIGRGEDVGLARDFAGTAVTQGAPPDVGAYQSA